MTTADHKPDAPRLVTITLDGHEIRVPNGKNLLQAILEAGVDLPYFCWHPALGAVGACRQCAVTKYQGADDQRGRVDMACMTPCSEGLRITVDDESSTAMREAVIEFLMTNHPHDCPVCEEGGECHLQDMTIMTGHAYRRYRGKKRTHRNQELGPFVGHEMNRCIACYRCVRYYKDYAGGTDLDVFGAHNHVYFGRAEDGTLESPFAGNLVEVCPTGVFTDKPLSQQYTRKWDLQSAPGICQQCSVGCNTLPGERYGRLKRVWNRYHGEINGYFLCDRGRFGSDYSNDEQRPRQPRQLGDETAVIAVDAALQSFADSLANGRVAGVGSPRASLESNFALRQLLGQDQYYQGVDEGQRVLAEAALAVSAGGTALATVRDIEHADAVFVLGEDLTNTAPRLALAVRQACRQKSLAMAREARIPEWQDSSVRTLAQQERSPVVVATVAADALDPVAAVRVRGLAAELTAFTRETAAAVSGDQGVGAEAREAAAALLAAQRPVVITGTSAGSLRLLSAAAELITALKQAGRSVAVACVYPEVNSVGSQLLGGPSLDVLLDAIERGDIDTLVVAENDLYRRLPRASVDAALARLKRLIVLDCVETETSRRAGLFLPAGSFAEADGTFVNFEGRAQRHFQTYAPLDSAISESWRWLQRVAALAGVDGLGRTLDELTRACAAAEPALAGITTAAPDADWRDAGSAVPRQSHRYSGRTAMHADRSMHEPKPPRDPDAPLAFSMEGVSPLKDKPAATIPIFWAPRWNSVQAVNKFQQEIGGALRGGDPGARLLAPSVEPPRIEMPATAEAPGLRLVSLPQIFGSDELSARSAPIRERGVLHPLRLHPDTADAHGLTAGTPVRVEFADVSLVLPLQLDASLDPRAVGLPTGCPGVPYFGGGEPASIAAEEGTGGGP